MPIELDELYRHCLIVLLYLPLLFNNVYNLVFRVQIVISKLLFRFPGLLFCILAL